jgi:acetyl-CoA synthetase
MTSTDIRSLLKEERTFPPPKEFSAKARCKDLNEYRALYEESVNSPQTFWARVAEELHWFNEWDSVLEWNPPHAKWFVGGTTNISYNCLDRHLDGPRADKIAFIWEGEPGDMRTRDGRSGVHLHAHGTGAPHRDVGLRSDRRTP